MLLALPDLDGYAPPPESPGDQTARHSRPTSLREQDFRAALLREHAVYSAGSDKVFLVSEMIVSTRKEIDVAVGARLRLYRRVAGLSLAGLAKQCGISHQQIQKYEKGINGISVSRLLEFSRCLNFSCADFLARIEADLGYVPRTEAELGALSTQLDSEFVSTKTGIRIVASLARVKDETALEAFADLIESLANK